MKNTVENLYRFLKREEFHRSGRWRIRQRFAWLETRAKGRRYEFLTMAALLKIRGAPASPIRRLATAIRRND